MSHTEHHHYTPEELHNVDVAHEEADVNVRTILFYAVGLAVVTMISAALMYGLFMVFERQAAASDPNMSPLAVPSTEMPRHTTETPFFGAAPQPQLLTNEPAVLQILRRTESERLHGYGWVDQQAGIAQIPIDEAKKLIAERGLPARGGAPLDRALGTHAPAYGEANSGRLIPRAGAPAPDVPRQTPEKAPEGSAPPAGAHKGGK